MSQRTFEDDPLTAIREAMASVDRDRATAQRRQWWEAEHGKPALVALVHPDQEQAIRHTVDRLDAEVRLEVRASSVASVGTIYVLDQSAIDLSPPLRPSIEDEDEDNWALWQRAWEEDAKS